MAWAVPFAGNLVRDFQYGHFRYWNVPPRRDKIAYEHGTLVLVPKMSHQKKKFKNDKFGFFLIFALVIHHWMRVLLLDSLLECLTKVIQEWLRPGSLIQCLTEKKFIWWTLWEELLLKNEQNYQYFWSKNWCLWRNFCILKAWETSERSKILPRNQYLVKWICTKSKKIAKETKFFAKKRGFSPGLG